MLKVLKRKKDWVTAKEIAQEIGVRPDNVYSYAARLMRFDMLESKREKVEGMGIYPLVLYRYKE